MPQGPVELYEEWETDTKAISFLRVAGYRLRRGWTWDRPQPPREPTETEMRALRYLFLEWDFGGLNDYAKQSN